MSINILLHFFTYQQCRGVASGDGPQLWVLNEVLKPIFDDSRHGQACGEFYCYNPSCISQRDPEMLAKAEVYGWFISRFQCITGRAPEQLSIFLLLYIISGKDNELFVQDIDFVAAFDRRRAEMLKLWDDIGIDGVIPGPRSKFGGDWMEMLNTSVCYLSFFIN